MHNTRESLNILMCCYKGGWFIQRKLTGVEIGINRKVVEGGTTRGTTALLYLQLHISLYTGTVHVLSSVVGVHPTSLTAD
jgi:hypothetical protein